MILCDIQYSCIRDVLKVINVEIGSKSQVLSCGIDTLAFYNNRHLLKYDKKMIFNVIFTLFEQDCIRGWIKNQKQVKRCSVKSMTAKGYELFHILNKYYNWFRLTYILPDISKPDENIVNNIFNAANKLNIIQ